MARLIDADALKQEFRKAATYFVRVWDTTGREKWEMEKDLSLKEIDEIIDNAPTLTVALIREQKNDDDEISNIAKESADKISKALDKVRAKGMQNQNIKEDDKP